MAAPVKTALITGANVGIGFETAKALAEKGYMTVMASRNKEKGLAAKNRIKTMFPNAKVESVTFDLSDLDSVRDFSKKALDQGMALDVLVNNAGVMACPQMTTKDGFEYQIGVNHLGHFLLTQMLLDLMKDPARPARIVNVASSAHLFGTINFDDIMSEKSYDRWRAYGQSKLANILFTRELSKRLGSDYALTANTLHPGVVATELSRYLLPENIPWFLEPLLGLANNFLLTPEQGAQTSIYLASSPKVEGVSGDYFDSCKPTASSPESKDMNVAKKLWDLSLELTNVESAI
ncbi:hypothetical protein BSKO_04944 [Bryopsis sp. KO-2023]|nr:hypothetical protein BSKO_04944 [Bryopsis sp. KO-2023]